MIAIDFYIGFEKRSNSTKRPSSGDTAYTISGYLREPCSLENPTINFKEFPANIHPQAYNYCFIPAFSRYYFVNDWTWNTGLWECSMTEDYLGSWKNQIGNTSAYIERSAYESDGDIIDKQYPATTKFEIGQTYINADWLNILSSNGCYVLGILSGNTYSSTGGAVTYYALTYAQLQALVDYLLSDQYIDTSGFPTTMTQDQQLTHSVAKALLDPLQYIVSCVWLPFTASDIGESSTRAIKVGYYPVPQTIAEGRLVDSTTSISYVQNIQIPTHPQSASRGHYLNTQPYTELQCYVPPFGSFPLDPQCFTTGDKIELENTFDLVTGKAILRVKRISSTLGDTPLLYETSAQLGVSIQLAQVSSDVIKSTTAITSIGANAAGAMANIMTGNAVGATHSGMMMLNSIGNAIDAKMPQVITSGSTGSFASLFNSAWLFHKFLYVVDEDNIELGRPLCKVRTISSQSGYVKCGEATVDYPCLAHEKEVIHRELLTGFFWE